MRGEDHSYPASYPETLQIRTMHLITSTTFICLVFLCISESKA